MEWIIYKHTSPSGNIYIGQTCKNPNYRWANGNGYKKAPKFWQAIKKYGWNNIKHDIIESGIKSQQIADEREIYWINFYNSYKLGYNATAGGGSQTHKSIPILMIDKINLKIVKEFYSASDAARELNCTQGEISSVCRKERIEAQGFYWCIKSEWHPNWKPKQKNFFNTRKIIKIDAITLRVIKEYDSIINAVKDSKLTKAQITNCCENQYTPINGYYWCYKENWDKNWKPRIKQPSKHGMRAIICIETLEVFESICATARAMNVSPGNIFSCCQSTTKTIKGLHFCYIENFDLAKNEISTQKHNKQIRCIELGTVFASMIEASQISGINISQISNCCSGKNITAGNLHWCFEKDYKNILKINPGKMKKVRCIELGTVYQSQAEAFKKTGIRHITECCKRKTPTAGGFHWCYEDDWSEDWKPLKKRTTKKILCIETNIIYDSIKEAANITGANYSEISKCCKHPKYTSGGYHWKFANIEKD